MLPEHEAALTVDELIDRLPATILLSRVPAVLGVETETLHDAITRGVLVTAGTGQRRRMRCAESRAFLAELLARRGAGAPAAWPGRPVSVTVTLPEPVFARLRAAAERRNLRVEQLAAEVMEAAFGGS